MIKKRHLIFLVSFILIISLFMTLIVGCSSKPSSKDDSSNGETQEGLLAEIKERGVLKVGTQSIMPAVMLDERTNKLIGVDGEVAEAIARELGVEIKNIETAWEGLIPGLQAKKYDMIVSGMYIKPERQEIVDFTTPYYGYGEGLAVAKANPKNIHGFLDFEGKTIGLQEGAAYLQFIEEQLGDKVEIKIYKNIPEMTLDLLNDRIDAFLTDKIIIAWDIKQHPDLKIELVEDYQSSVYGECGAAVRKEDKELTQKVSEIITEMKQSGELLEILKRYGLDETNLPK
jgi:ABC-type amino acid transport substrate-binding protein